MSTRLNSEAVVAAAMGLTDRDAGRALTLAGLAQHLSIRPPSLYTHVSSLEDLNRRVAEKGAALLVGAIRDAAVGRSGKDALRSLANAYRRFAKDHPGIYARIFDPESGRETGRAVSGCVNQAVAPNSSDEDHVEAARIVFCALHGFVSLELAGQLASEGDVEKSFDRLVKVLWKSMP